MSNARKLQTEIDRVMKKIDEGVELFDEIWEKVYSAEQQNQKEKYELDLKKEIKKLQRLRDQIKSWIGGSEVKDKGPLLEARRLIETKMEQFKICEKETKTKTYSKEGLARAEKLDPHEQAKHDECKWMQEFVDQLNQLVEDAEVEVERLQSGKGKKTNKSAIEDHMDNIQHHKFHINKLEGIMRLIMNDTVEVETVKESDIKSDLEYYLESYDDPDYLQAYDEDFFYEALGLGDLDVVNVDRVTQSTSLSVSSSSKNKKEDADVVSATSSKGSRDTARKSKKVSTSSVIPLTIGRARASKSKSKGGSSSNNNNEDDKNSDHDSIGASSSKGGGSVTSGPTTTTPSKGTAAVATATTPTTIPAATPNARTPPPGASMASILKRETEQQERERQKARAQAAEQQARLVQEQQQQQAAAAALLQEQQQLAAAQKLQQEQEALREQQQQQAAAAAAAQQEALLRQQQQQLEASSVASVGSNPKNANTTNNVEGLLANLSLEGPLAESLGQLPSGADASRAAFAAAANDPPQNPYLAHASYPTTVPDMLLDNPAIFEKLGTDCLFFIFYYSQGTYQQYLAARELKKQSWRYHKKFLTWFQRHDEPKVTTDEYEQGTYVYFDYETGWCTRIKQDFRFEYSFLEDQLQ